MVHESVRPSMLIRFAGENVRSFRAAFEISLLATAVAEKGVVRQIPWREGETKSNTLDVLPVAGFFGANASGKSNILRAINDMRSIVLQSFRAWTDKEATERHPFVLGDRGRERPSRYEIDIVLDGVLHRYGFVLDDVEILQEWAIRFPKGREQRIFDRSGEDIHYGTGARSALVRAGEVLRPNALLLSTAVAFKGSELRPLYDWFVRNLRLANAANRDSRQVFTAKQLEDDARREKILRLLRAADLGVIDAEEVDFDRMPEEVREKLEKVLEILNDGSETPMKLSETPNLIALVHRGADGKRVRFNHDEESLGTVVWLGLAGPVIDALDQGSVLLADELDASLHPVLVQHLVQLFQDPEANPRRAQLLFNSHDAHLLGDSSGDRPLGRDQVWFTEKGDSGESTVYPLSDLNPRRQEAVAKRYLEGRYGAIPIVSPGDFAAAVHPEPVG
jgi:hypothetical protein